MEKIGRRDGEQSEAWNILAQLIPGGEGFGHDRTHGDDRGLGVWARFTQPVATRERAFTPAITTAFDLRDAPCREAQVRAFALGIVDQLESFLDHGSKL